MPKKSVAKIVGWVPGTQYNNETFDLREKNVSPKIRTIGCCKQIDVFNPPFCSTFRPFWWIIKKKQIIFHTWVFSSLSVIKQKQRMKKHKMPIRKQVTNTNKITRVRDHLLASLNDSWNIRRSCRRKVDRLKMNREEGIEKETQHCCKWEWKSVRCKQQNTELYVMVQWQFWWPVYSGFLICNKYSQVQSVPELLYLQRFHL